MITEKITAPQQSEMGMGFGALEGIQDKPLKEVLEFIKENFKTWGLCTITDSFGALRRKFDYDLYNNNIFYYHLAGWESELKVKEVEFSFCFMSRDITIEVE